MQAGRQASSHADRQAGRQAGKQARQQHTNIGFDVNDCDKGACDTKTDKNALFHMRSELATERTSAHRLKLLFNSSCKSHLQF